MVVVQRNEVNRNRILYWLTMILSAAVLAGIATTFGSRPETVQSILALVGVAAMVALILAAFQLWSHPKRSQVLLIQRDDQIVVATNALHEGFKLRFLRDVLTENISSFSDEERNRWKVLEPDGFYAAFGVRNVRKVLVLRLCTMIFDDVFVADRQQRWEYHDSSNTAEPSFSRRRVPQVKGLTRNS